MKTSIVILDFEKGEVHIYDDYPNGFKEIDDEEDFITLIVRIGVMELTA